jgi:hypothetical protein
MSQKREPLCEAAPEFDHILIQQPEGLAFKRQALPVLLRQISTKIIGH